MIPFAGNLKLIAILVAVTAVVGGTFWAAWSWRSSIAVVEVREAVDTAIVNKVKEIQESLDKERDQRATQQQEVAAALRSMLGELRTLQKTQIAVSKSVAVDRANNRDFYEQPLPELGRQAWIQARTAASASAPASSASAP